MLNMNLNTKLITTTIVVLFSVYMFWNVFAVIGILYVVSLVNGEKLKQLRDQLVTPEMTAKMSKFLRSTKPQESTDLPISVF